MKFLQASVYQFLFGSIEFLTELLETNRKWHFWDTRRCGLTVGAWSGMFTSRVNRSHSGSFTEPDGSMRMLTRRTVNDLCRLTLAVNNNKSVVSLLRRLSTWRCSQLLLNTLLRSVSGRWAPEAAIDRYLLPAGRSAATYRISFGLVDVCMSDYVQLISSDGDRTVTRGNPFKLGLSVNYCRTNTRKNFLANVL